MGGEQMIVCWRTVEVPSEARERFLSWIDENRELRESHGILFELVLEPAARQNPAKTLGTFEPSARAPETVVVTAWSSHDAFDEWIDTPDRDRLTASDEHGAVGYRPLTRYDVVGGYLDLDGLAAVAGSPKEVHP
jgi:hypothetical protein